MTYLPVKKPQGRGTLSEDYSNYIKGVCVSAALITGDAIASLKTLESECVQCCVTSPPYFRLRDYGIDGQIGLEETPDEYIARLVAVFSEVKRVLKPDGTLWVNLGDSYAAGGKGGGGSFMKERRDSAWQSSSKANGYRAAPRGYKPKDLLGMPWKLAFALQAEGWYLRADIIWNKKNPMPESVSDRPTKAHEYIFLLSKSPKYLYNADAIREPVSEETVARALRGRSKEAKYANGAPGQTANTLLSDMSRCYNPKGRNKRTVWTTSVSSYRGAHFATFPENLVTPCVLAGSNEGDTVLDVFSGAATTGVVCHKTNRNYIGIELNPEYQAVAQRRLEEME